MSLIDSVNVRPTGKERIRAIARQHDFQINARAVAVGPLKLEQMDEIDTLLGNMEG
jgi:hypothetical protein